MTSTPIARAALPGTAAPRRRAALLHGVSATALMVAGAAQAAPFKSLGQALALSNRAAQAAVAPANAVTASQQAVLGAQNLARAATRFRSLADALANTAAGTASGAGGLVVDGYGAGRGLQAAPGAAAGSANWQGASLPTSSTAPGGVTVTVTQSQPLAQLTWQTFNVGRHTTLNFDQSAGGKLASSWIVINKVLDPQANGSLIEGAINAQGKVYVLNRNGIAFTQGSTINVGSLIAATADIAASQFATTASGVTSFNLYSTQTPFTDPKTGLVRAYQPSFDSGSAASITVAPGASIQTAAPTGTNAGGYVMLLGGNVSNAGIISTPQGQTVLAAGVDFTLRQGTQGSTSTGNLTSTTLGSEVAATNYGTSTAGGFVTVVPVGVNFPTGSVSNSGIVVADQGDISLVGHALTQSGILLSTTTVDTRGTIHLLTPTDGTDDSATVTLAPGSVTEILPEDDGLTALSSQRAANIAGSAVLNQDRANKINGTITLNNTDYLADQLGESRVEISTGGAVDVGAGALVVAQGGQIAIGGGSRVLVETGANLDVSGTTNAILPASINDILVNVQPFQTRDAPGNRNTLKGINLYVDAETLVEIAGGAYGGNIYTPGGAIEVGGYLGLIPHSIAEFTANGGQVTLQASQVQLSLADITKSITVPGAVITQPGSTINLQGGTVSYQAGAVAQSYLQAADGQVYNVNTAPGDLVYTGVYDGFVVDRPRWQVTNYYINPLLTPATLVEPGYTVGRDAGSITIAAGTDVIQGTIAAGVTLGQFQNGPRPNAVTDPFLLAQTVVPQAGTLAVGNYLSGILQTLTTPTQIVFQATQGPAATITKPSPSTVGTVAAPVFGTATIDAPVLVADGLSTLLASTGGNITVNAPFGVANGGTISLTGAHVAVDATLTARSGTITLTDQLLTPTTSMPVAPHTGITLGAGATLDARGVWTNNRIDPSHQASLGYANGGNVTIAGSNGVTLAAGSTIDVSSGGALLATGRLLTGRGGDITVVADQPFVPADGNPELAPIVFDARFVGVGSGGGGTLSLAAPAFRIGGTGPAGFDTVALDPALFATGFASYVVDGFAQLAVAPGTQITAAEPIYVIGAGLAVPTGRDPSQAYTVVLPPLYLPSKGSDALTERGGASVSLLSSVGPGLPLPGDGGPVTIGAGAVVAVDPGQSITVAGYGQVSVFGTLIAHGGRVLVANTSYGVEAETTTLPPPSDFRAGVSIWLGGQSVIDVSGQAVVQTDPPGRSFGQAGSGGTITLGSYQAGAPTFAQVIERPGAVLDADGATAQVTVVPGLVDGSLVAQPRPVTLVGNGGTIAIDSITGIALDGTASARAGGPGAAGGALSLTLDAINLQFYGNIPTAVYQPREILVSTDAVAGQPAALLPGGLPPADTYGLVRVSQQQIDAGGYDSVNLSALGGEIVFDGSVPLRAASSITLATGTIGDTVGGGSVSISAPVVNLVGVTRAVSAAIGNAVPSSVASDARLAVLADLINIGNTLDLGGSQVVSSATSAGASGGGGTSSGGTTGSSGTSGGGTTGTGSTGGSTTGTGSTPVPVIGPPAKGVSTVSFGFVQADLVSTGDIRFLGSADGKGTLASAGNLAFEAAQLTTGAGAAGPANNQIIAGFNPANSNQAALADGGTITITRTPGSAAAPPSSIGGTLQFIADDIVQGGTVRAPEGTLVFSDGSGQSTTVFPSKVSFGAGSTTSVSLDGQTVPYGGTIDGVTYQAPGGFTPALFRPRITVQAQSITAAQGATLDLRGGGTLTGAGFVFGRGGSADVLTTPLLDVSAGAALANADAQVAAVAPLRTNDPVYAILPGYGAKYAPAAAPGDTGYTAIQPGEQITIGAGVPGLAAGTYTLLPAYYALLPGGYRIELTGGVLPAGANLSQGNFTSVSPATLSFANTAISSPLPTDALITSGTNVRQLSQYDEESYNSFEAASSTQFGGPRPFLPQDAKTLELIYPGLVTSSTGTSSTGTSSTGTSSTGTSSTGTASTGTASTGISSTSTSSTGTSSTGTSSSGTSTSGTTTSGTSPGDGTSGGATATTTVSLATLPALTLPATALLKAPAAGGYGATIEVDSTLPIVVTGRGDVAPPGTVALDAATLDALDIPRLVLGGTLTTSITAADTFDINASGALTPSVDIMPHAVLVAGDILLTTVASGQITVEPGGTISTLGAGPAAYDATNGYLFNNQFQNTAYPVLDISNGHVVFVPNTQPSTGAAISIGAGSGVLAAGSLDVVAPNDTVVTIAGSANLGAADVSIAVAAINIGSAQSLAAYASQLPSGFSLTPQSLSTLLNGNPALGTPASSVLTLTATQEVNLVGPVALDTGRTNLVLNTPAIYGVAAPVSAATTATAASVAAPAVGTPDTQTASITAANFTWSGIAATGSLALNANGGIAISGLPGGQIAAGLKGQPEGALAITAGTITLGYGPDTQQNDQIVLDRVIAGFGNVTLTGTTEITANNQSALAVYASQPTYGSPGTGGNLTLAAPLVTTDSAAVLQLTAGGALALTRTPGNAPIAPVNTLGGQIDLAASTITLDTSIALPSGQLDATAQGDIEITAAARLDLSGRAVHFFDQTLYAPGGTLAFESTAGSITLATGSTVDVSATGTSAGAVAFNALAGGVMLDGTLLGSADAGQTGGSFTVIAGTLASATQAVNVLPGGSAFDAINAGLNAGGFTASRSFEFGTDIGPSGTASTNLVIGNDTGGHALLAASAISVTADLGSIDVAGIIDASGTGPGAITLAAQQNLTIETTALLDAHASRTALDSYGQPIDADNRAHVTLTSIAGTLALLGGTVDLRYAGLSNASPAAADAPQGQLVLNVARVGADDAAITAAAPLDVLGAQSIALYAWRTYLATDANGTVAQSARGHAAKPGTPILTLNAIDADSTAFIDAAGANIALTGRLAGLTGYASSFHLRPGVEIDSTAASGGNITISGDVDLSFYRYSDPTPYGLAQVAGVYGSGEPGAILFRAANDLVVNGSVTDGFAPPPDKKPANYILADDGWLVFAPSVNNAGAAYDPLGADVILPSSLVVTTTIKGVTTTYHHIQLLPGTTFDESRPVSLNYAITIASANIGANEVIPFSARVAADANGLGVIIPQGGFVTTALIIEANGSVIASGTFLPGGTVIPPGSLFSAGSLFPAPVQVAQNTLVPAGTLLSIFDDTTLTLSKRTGTLPVDAFIPSNTDAQFGLPDGTLVTRLALRATELVGPNSDKVQGYLYALSDLLPAGSQSWDLGFVAGANQASADTHAVLPRSVLDGGALAVPANTANQAPGSLILDDQHYLIAPNGINQNGDPAFSVIRTGTGNLSLLAGGDFDQSSLYGIYTAGAQDPLPGGAAANAPYDLPREGVNGDKYVVPGGLNSTYNQILRSTYRANYPSGGGDVLLSAQGSVTGDLYGGAISTAGGGAYLTSDGVGNWLWRQGSTQLGISTAWWINFGTLVYPYSAGDVGFSFSPTQLTGFQGIGALGGGNVTVIAGQDAGQTTDRSGDGLTGSVSNAAARGEGLVIAVGSTGREISTNGTQSILQTGGGNLTLRVAGTINPIDAQAYSGGSGAALNGQGGATLNGTVIDLRGNIAISAGAVGRLDETYPGSSTTNEPDPRPLSPYTPLLTASDGLTIVPGDGTVSVNTQRDLVLDGVADPGRVTTQSLTRVLQSAIDDSLSTTGGATGFTLWTPATALSLFAAGGNAAPITSEFAENTAQTFLINDAATDNRFVYPSQLYVTAAAGDITFGNATAPAQLALELAPSSNQQLAFLAGGSIQGNGMAIDLSGADPAGLSRPLDPAFSTDLGNQAVALTNIRTGAATTQSTLALFALEPDTPTTGYLSARAAATPALFYAAGGDILDLVTGQTLTFASAVAPGATTSAETLPQWYLAAKPVRIMAAQDIVDSGTRPDGPAGAAQQNQAGFGTDSYATASGDLFLNTTAQSVSVVSAGRDILSGYFYVGGPGLLEVDAGRNIQQIGFAQGANGISVLAYGAIKSLGSLLSGAPISLTGGADLYVSAGLATGADYSAFADLYLDPANQADLALPITSAANIGKVQQTYADQLLAYLQQNYFYTGTQAGALAWFQNAANVPVASQDAFLRGLFFTELLASGRQYNDPASRFHLSYARGRQVIDALLPGTNGATTTNGTPAGYAGALTMASGNVISQTSIPLGQFDAGIATEHGGNIEVLNPGGQLVIGTSGGANPGAGTGIITNGSGNIAIFSDGSVLLGKSRIFTNAGGNIQIWSSDGDINAGIGARTTVVFNPPVISYDDTGGLVETPAVPTSGAGIATQQPLASIPPGNIDLTAPVGTIDAGEAGVRSSGNLNLAAARLANTAGFTSGGKTSGNAAAPSVSLTSVEAASSTAGATQAAAQALNGGHTESQLPSVIEVEVLSVSGESDEERRRKAHGL